MIPMYIDVDYRQVQVPPAIIRYCDDFTTQADRESLRYLDCIYMHMGLYGNDPEHLRRLREYKFF